MSKPWANSRSQYVARMFGEIADRYDLMNRVMTLGQDQRWRRQAADKCEVGSGEVVLDVATGTGDLAIELAGRVGPNGRVIGIDFSEPMLDLARQKIKGLALPLTFQEGDALHLPFDSESFDAISCGFGLRNFDDRQRGLEEMVRVARPGGRVVILELTPPKNALTRQYMDEVVPRLGGLLARARDAYTYLPESVQEFPDAKTLGRMMQAAGLRQVTYRLLNFGTIALHWGKKTAEQGRQGPHSVG